jgi:WD40 repeat protein
MKVRNRTALFYFGVIFGWSVPTSVSMAQQTLATPVWKVKCHESKVVDLAVNYDQKLIASVDEQRVLVLSKYEWPETLCAEGSTTPFRKLEWAASGDLYALKESGKIQRFRSDGSRPFDGEMVDGWTDGRNLLAENGNVYVVEGRRFGLVSEETVRTIPPGSHGVGAIANNQLLMPAGNLKMDVHDLSGGNTKIALTVADSKLEELVDQMWVKTLLATKGRIFALFGSMGSNAIGVFDADGTGKIVFSTGHEFGWKHESISEIAVSKSGRYLVACGSKCRIWEVDNFNKHFVVRGSIPDERNGSAYFSCACVLEKDDGGAEVVFGTIDGYLGRVVVKVN